MSDDAGESDDLDELMPSVSEDRPLDSLMPEMRTLGGAGEGAPSQVPPVHPRVLEVGLESGSEWTLAVWGEPGEGVADQIEQLVRATILMELSKPPNEELLARTFRAVRILVFADLADSTVERLGGIGFERAEYVADQYEERMAAWRKEAAQADIQLPGAPASVWELEIAHPAGDTAQLVDGIAQSMTERLADQPWGATPGAVSRLLARRLEKELDIEIGLDPTDIDRMSQHLVPQTSGAIRWVPSIIFQALCDYIGVLAHGAFERELQWGLCEENEQGIVPPPTFRDPSGGEPRMVPVGRAMMEWVVMPKRASEQLEQIPLSRRVASLIRPSQ